jgi:hypothetical protein
MTASNSAYDEMILSHARSQWQKVAMVVAKTLRECETKSVSASPELIAERVTALVTAGRLESQGNLIDWRRSEVRLPLPRNK